MEGRQWSLYTLKGSLKYQHFLSTLLGGREGGHEKEYSVYAFDNVDNYGRAIKSSPSVAHATAVCPRLVMRGTL